MTDGLTDNFHFKMMELDVVTHLVSLLQKSDLNGRESSAKAIINLAKFGMLLSYSELLRG